VKVAALVPPPSKSAPFEYREICALPDAPGCYALTNAATDILYIGQASFLRRRLLQHFDAGRHRALTSGGRVSLMWTVAVDRLGTLSAHERGWLNQCELADGVLPCLNKVHAPI
jgi:hypothetical protein